jgi:uncharacterized protein YbaP (TraB family)
MSSEETGRELRLDPRYLQGREPSFVVAGTGHMGGPDGVLALLKARGYRIDEL